MTDRVGADESGDSATATGTSSDPAVAVRDLTKVFDEGGDEVVAVDGIDFAIDPGTAVGLLGPNGAGKTTTIKSILSLIVPTSGDVRVSGIDVDDDPAAAQERTGAMLEGARNVYWRLTVRENLELFSVLGGVDYRDRRERLDELLEQFDLEAKAETVVRELSRGQKQKVSVACTMAQDADVVFLDEPTLGLDVESSLELRRELRNLVRDDGTTVVLSSHDMDVVQDVCDRVVIMNEGRVVADDSVESLLDLFDTQTYEVTVSGTLSSQVRSELESRFNATGFEARRDGTQFRVQIGGDQFYPLVDALRVSGLRVESIDSADPDLEDVFLTVTGEGDAESGTARPRDGGRP